MTDSQEIGSEEVPAEELFYGSAEPEAPTDEAETEQEFTTEAEETESAEEPEGQPEAEEESEGEELVFDQPNDFAKYNFDEESGLYEFKANGQRVKANIETLINKFQGNQKVESTLEELANERKGVFSEAKNKELDSLRSQQSEYQERIKTLDDLLNNQQSATSLEEQLETGEIDHVEYVKLSKAKADAQDELKAAKLADQQAQTQLKQQRATDEAQKLMQGMGWTDPQEATKELNLIYDYAETQGISREEIPHIVDNRFWITMSKAKKFDELQASANKAKSVAKPHKTTKTTKPAKQAETVSEAELFYGYK